MPDEPVLLALIAADKVIIEHQNFKRTIIGTFVNFFSATYPVQFMPWAVYFSVTNMSPGWHDFTTQIQSVSTGQVILSAVGKFQTNALDEAPEVVVAVAPLFPEPGKYEIRLLIQDRFVGSRYLNVKPVNPGAQQ